MSEYIYSSQGELLANERGEISLPRCEIVRCKDCKHASAGEAVISGNWQMGSCHNPRFRMSLHAANVRADGFCAWATRKEDE